MSRIKIIAAIVAVFALAASLAFAQGGSTTTGGSTSTAPAATAPAKAAPAEKPMMAEKSTTAEKPKMKGEKHAMMMKCDLNSAPKEELMKLSGIDDATADKIVAARPFKSRGELMSKNILTKAQYSKVSSHVTVKSAKASKEMTK
ncbi:MAG: helix-hairpin-helix domain-containing protein [Candidatus Eisenbacteria bacterium]|nr:helix-hairpin-helix domain-containing protein [Candidatus Eisenbacteria bacterium]